MHIYLCVRVCLGTLLVSFLLVSGVWLWALWKASASASGSEPLAAEPEAAGVVQAGLFRVLGSCSGDRISVPLKGSTRVPFQGIYMV